MYAAYLTPQGRMISDMRVIETGSRMLLSVDRDVAAPLAERLDKLIFSEDVQVEDVRREIAVLGVHGPSAAAHDPARDRRVGCAISRASTTTSRLASLTIVRDDALGVPGFDVYVPRERSRCHAREADRGRCRAGERGDVAEALRIEAGRPRFGVDMTTDTIPLEAGIEDRAISFTKGCYVGQEVIVRVMHRGHGRVARRLVSIVIAGGDVPARGDTILLGDRHGRRDHERDRVTQAGSARSRWAMCSATTRRPAPELTVGGSQARIYQAVD